jgi:N-acetylneuraminic acid mutarotase
VLGGNLTLSTWTTLHQIYDPETDSWSTGAPFEGARDFAMAEALSDGIHLIAGRDARFKMDHQVYDPETDTWSTRAPLPAAIDAATIESIADRIYVIGGNEADRPIASVLVYDPDADAWMTGAPMPTPRFSAASTEHNGRILVAGGTLPNQQTSNALEAYDPAHDHWEVLAPMPFESSALGGGLVMRGGMVGNLFCVFGGRLAPPTGMAFSETFCYDPAADSWSRGPDMLTPRVEMAFVDHGGDVYAIGGRSSSTIANRAVERLRARLVDPVLRWRRAIQLPVAVRAAAAARLDRYVAVLGGSTANGHSDLVQVFDIEAGAWLEGPKLPSPRDFAMALTIGEQVHLLGGADPGILRDHFVIDEEKGGWMPREPLPLGVNAAAAHAIGGRLFVIGGGRGGANATDAVQIYDTATDKWSAGAPMPTARFSAASALLGGWIYIAGGQGSGVTTLDVVERYHARQNRWETLPPLPASREALGGGVLGEQFCVFGGRSAVAQPTGDAFRQTWCFAARDRAWVRGPDMKLPRVEMAVVQIGGGVLTLGGRTRDNLAVRAGQALTK